MDDETLFLTIISSTLKQWKRFGAGCYPYECADGLLHIIVRNVSLPCEREGQNLEVRLKKGKWLHEGSIICPACSDFCGDACLPKAVPRVAAPDLKEDIDNTCFREGLNGLQGFFRNFGLANLAGGAEGAGSGGEE